MKEFAAENLKFLLEELKRRDYQVIGPRVNAGAITLDELRSIDELPRRTRDVQSPGSYRLQATEEAHYFGFSTPCDAWKKFLYPAKQTLWRAEKTDEGLAYEEVKEAPPKLALFGMRSCDLAALTIHDRVFANDRRYKTRRKRSLIIVVDCEVPGGNCFCTSMGTGPGAEGGFDLRLTEVIKSTEHSFLVESATPVGEEILTKLPATDAASVGEAQRSTILERAERAMPKEIDAEKGPGWLMASLDHPRWDEIAERCLSCANCTMACPTCFCTDIQDVSNLTGTKTEAVRTWDSCFHAGHSYIHGGAIRASTKSRYRQWLTHKLATWKEQFETSGCVGCGRCITWCPVGIDFTEELPHFKPEEEL